jgi:hypothetical protein
MTEPRCARVGSISNVRRAMKLLPSHKRQHTTNPRDTRRPWLEAGRAAYGLSRGSSSAQDVVDRGARLTSSRQKMAGRYWARLADVVIPWLCCPGPAGLVIARQRRRSGPSRASKQACAAWRSSCNRATRASPVCLEDAADVPDHHDMSRVVEADPRPSAHRARILPASAAVMTFAPNEVSREASLAMWLLVLVLEVPLGSAARPGER